MTGPGSPRPGTGTAIRVLFAPDWREGVPYQQLLAGALAAEGVEVLFPRGYRRGLPVARMAGEAAPQILHLHWPEAYYAPKPDAFSSLRLLRFPLDLRLVRQPLVVTAHNLFAHNVDAGPLLRHAAATPFRRASAIIAHSAAAADAVARAASVDRGKIRVIPHGDLSAALGPPEERAAARARLGLDGRPVALMFGAVEPYKGVEEMIALWRQARPGATLRIVGRPIDAGYGEIIRSLAAGVPGVEWCPGRLPDEELRLWLSAADAAVFNYRRILTSGAASLARSYGLPVLIPRHLDTLDLAEPDPAVIRFSADDFPEALRCALGVRPDYARAAGFREAISWPGIAGATAALYRELL